MIKKIIKFILLSFSILLLSACNDEINDLTMNQKEIIITTETDSTILALSKVLASTMNDKDVLKTISDKVLQKIDGDCNTLLVDAMTTPIESGNLKSSSKMLLNYIEENYIQESSGLRSSRSDFINKINKMLDENPLLQIAIPSFDQDFNGDISKIQNPIVTFLPENYNEKTTEWLIGFDMNGNEIRLNAKQQPNFPVIIVSQNERLIAVPKVRLRNSLPGENYQLVYSSSTYDYYAPFPFFGDNHPLNPPRVLYPAPLVDRDENGYRDFLSKARFTSQDAMREFESWGRGRPEVDFAYAYISKAGAQSVKNYLGDKYWYNGNTRFFDISIFHWDPIEVGKYMKYIFIESDGGKSAGIETTLTSSLGVSTKVTIPSEDKDQVICESVVSYEDPALGDGTKYGNTFFEFWVNIHQ